MLATAGDARVHPRSVSYLAGLEQKSRSFWPQLRA